MAEPPIPPYETTHIPVAGATQSGNGDQQKKSRRYYTDMISDSADKLFLHLWIVFSHRVSSYVIVAKEEPAYLIGFSRFGTYGLDPGWLSRYASVIKCDSIDRNHIQRMYQIKQIQLQCKETWVRWMKRIRRMLNNRWIEKDPYKSAGKEIKISNQETK